MPYIETGRVDTKSGLIVFPTSSPTNSTSQQGTTTTSTQSSIAISSSPTVPSITVSEFDVTIIAGDGLTVTENQIYTIALNPTGVTSGHYTNANLFIDTYGRITGASSGVSGEINYGTNVGSGSALYKEKDSSALIFKTLVGEGLITITEDANQIYISAPDLNNEGDTANIIGENGILVSGTLSNTVTLSLQSSGVTPGTYTAPTLHVNTQGVITSISSNSLNSISTANNIGNGSGIFANKDATSLNLKSIVGTNGTFVTADENNIYINGVGDNSFGSVQHVDALGTDNIVVSGGPITTNGQFTIGVADSGVLSGTYTNPTLTINRKGFITSASSGSTDYSGTNLGQGSNVFAQTQNKVLSFRSLIAGPGITLAETANDITITSTIASGLRQVNQQTNGNYILSLNDNRNIVIMKNLQPNTVSIPNTLPVGYSVTIKQGGVGQTQIVSQTGAAVVNCRSQTHFVGINAVVNLFVDSNVDGMSAIATISGDLI